MNEYKWHNTITESSDFAKTLDYKDKLIIDLGCGNGRDTLFFLRNNLVEGIDNDAPDGTNFKAMDISEYLDYTNSDVDVVYCRFLFHVISEQLEDKIIEWAAKHAKELAIEVRAIGDQPIMYTDHERRFADPVKLWEKIQKAGFDNLTINLGHGFARYKLEDPYILRIIAKK